MTNIYEFLDCKQKKDKELIKTPKKGLEKYKEERKKEKQCPYGNETVVQQLTFEKGGLFSYELWRS